MEKEKQTASTRYLLRPLGIIKKDEKIDSSKLKDFGFIDAFIKDVNHKHDYTHPLYLLFRQKEIMTTFREFVQDEYERGLLLEDYDYPEGHIVLLYDYPEKFKQDYDKIMAGKYSETSKEFQKCFPESIEIYGKTMNTVQFMVFNKDQYLRDKFKEEYDIDIPEDSEVWSIPYEEKETLDIQNYIDGKDKN